MSAKQMLWVLAVVAVGMVCWAGAAQASITNGPYDLAVKALNPVVRYQFEEASGTTALNTGSAGASLDGTYTAGVSLNGTSAFAQLGDAGVFSGSTGYVSIPVTTVFGATNKSIEFWFCRDTSSITGRRDVWADKVTSGKDFGILSDNGGASRVQIFKEYPSPFSGGGMTQTGIADNAWHHLVLTMVNAGASSTWKLYIDGSQVGADMVGQTFEYDSNWDGSTKRRLGTNGDTGTSSFPGLIDEFALYPTTLTAAQVANLYNKAQIPEPATLALLGLGGLGVILGRKRR